MTFRTELLRVARGYWLSQVLFAANGIGIFGALASEPAAAEEVARACGTEVGATTRLLNACVAVGLLAKTDGRYQNAPIAEALLVPGKTGYLGHWVGLMADLYQIWDGLEGTVRSGEPVGVRKQAEGGHHGGEELFALAMHEFAIGPGREFVDRVNLAGRRHLLDIGGGVGSYSMLLAQRYPGLKATVFDTPPIVEIARGLTAEVGLDGRISTRGGDYRRDEFGTGYDTALLSNVLHQEELDTCGVILQKAFEALVPGGLVIVHGIHMNPDGTGPLWAVMHSLRQLLLGGGQVYSVEETVMLLTEAGFTATEVLPLSLLNGGSIITAKKPSL